MKVLNTLGNIAILGGVVLLLGAAGSSDCGTSILECMRMVGIAAALVLAGMMAKIYVSEKGE